MLPCSEGDNVYSADLLTGDLNIRTCRKIHGFNFRVPAQPRKYAKIKPTRKFPAIRYLIIFL